MKTSRFIFLPLLLCFCAATAQSQAPQLSGAMSTSLQGLLDANKALIEKQKKTLELLDKLDENAQQLKFFGKRS